jgi:hypothetical protein
MRVTLSTPTYLVGQRAENVFDAPWLPRGTAPAGVLGSSLTTDISVLQQATRLGFTPSGYSYG